MRRLLIVLPEFEPVPAVNNGGVEQLAELFIKENEKQKKYLITVVSKYHSEAKILSEKYKYADFVFIKTRWFERAVNKCMRFLVRLILRREEPNFVYRVALTHRIRRMRFDCVLLENRVEFAQMLHEITGIKPLLHIHNHNKLRPQVDRLFDIIENSSGVVSVSDYLLREIESQHQQVLPIPEYIVHNAVDEKIFQHNSENTAVLKKALGVPDKGRIVLFVGRTIPEKGTDKLISAFQMLHLNDLYLVVVGSKWYRDGAEINKNDSISNVVFTGSIPNAELPQYYNIADLAVFPSQAPEAAGLVQIESMLVGVPTIVSSSGGMPEYVNSQDQVVPLGHNFTERLSRKMSDILSLSPQQWNQLAMEEKKAAREYTSEKYFQRLSKVLDDESHQQLR